MDHPTEPGRHSSDGWRRLNELADRLENAWQNAETVDLGTLLPASTDPLRPTALRELIKTDLEIRWRRGMKVELELYLRQFPELGPPHGPPAELLYEEYRVRQLYGDQPTIEAYQARFPERFDEFRRLVEDRPMPTVPNPKSQPVKHEQPPVSEPSRDSNTLLPIGGGYHLEKLIGRGASAEVWRAMAPGGFAVAVKIISRPADHEERLREVDALENLKQLHHHFLIRTHAYYSEPDRLYIIMDLAEGSLRDRLRECRKAGDSGIPSVELSAYFREAAEAMDYMHAKGVLHRDIKPDNILLIEGHVRVADFGLIRQQAQKLIEVSGSGTVAYMPPEVWGGKAGASSDQYSLAYTYAELRLGRRPFTSTDFASLMFDHLEHDPDLAALPSSEGDTLRKALAKNPEARFATCMNFARALETAIASRTHIATVAPQPTYLKGHTPDTQELSPSRINRHLVDRPSVETDSSDDSEYATPLTTDNLPSLLPGRKPKVATPPDHSKNKGQTPHWSGKSSQSSRKWAIFLVTTLVMAAVGVGLAILAKKMWPAPVNPTILLPDGFKVASVDDDVVTDFKGRKFHRKIVLDFPGRPPIPFVLIEQKTVDDLPTFYVMETKVSYEQFVQFAKERREAVQSNWPDDAAKAKLPALGMTLTEAKAMAKWLHEKGTLPTTKQWDKAAGFLERGSRTGPAGEGRTVAVDLRGKGPRRLDAESDDVSPLGIREMAGNGTEFTRDIMVDKSDPPRQLVILRGQSYTAARPLTYADLVEQQNQEQARVQFEEKSSPFTGFRVVVELE